MAEDCVKWRSGCSASSIIYIPFSTFHFCILPGLHMLHLLICPSAIVHLWSEHWLEVGGVLHTEQKDKPAPQ